MGLSSCNNYETSNGTNDKIDPSMLNYESIYNSHKNSKIYTEEEANDLFKKFMNNNQIQGSFHNEKTPDISFNKLKKEEKEKLVDYFNSKKGFYQNMIDSKIRQSNIPNHENLVKNFMNMESAQKGYNYKIEECIKKIENNEDSYKIEYLTVMLVGKSGVGKSTLINNVLKLGQSQKAKTGTGKFQTIKIDEYQSEAVKFLKLIDTRGIELNVQYGAEAVKRDAKDFIDRQLESNNVNNFVHCIWYCITGNRFEQVEIDLLNSLKNSYGDNNIPIIIVYTQATDNNTINEMKEYIKTKNIDANFIRVLAERKQLIDYSYLESFGLDELIRETLEKCKKALKGDMFSVITRKISEEIFNTIKSQNITDKGYIIKEMKIYTIKNFGNVREIDNFIYFIIHLFGFIITILFETEEGEINDKNRQIFLDSSLINFFKNLLIKNNEFNDNMFINQIAYEFMDLQVLVQKNNKKEISFENQRTINDFKITTKKFLDDNFNYLSQKMILNLIFSYIFGSLLDEFIYQSNELSIKLLNETKIRDQIKRCFFKKYSEFEERLKKSIKNY
jgi:predicted GTPase